MSRYPLRVEARRDETVSRWLWLVKWLLLIPHYLVLAVLWVGFIVLTLVAYVAVLITGRYPAAIQAYNTGVLRWSWRVGYYGYQALGTDRYPPFTLADVPDYPARLQIDGPSRPPRWLPLVAWLFAIPHLMLVAALTGAGTWQYDTGDGTASVPLGVVAIGILIVGISVLFTGRYPGGLYDLLVGVARWGLRVLAYLALLTPRYPPFRLDQGDREPDDGPAGPDGDRRTPSSHSSSAAGPVSALIAGVILLLPAAGLGVAGGALLALSGQRDSSGYVTSPIVHLSSSSAAITAEGLTIEGADVWTRNLTDVGGVRIAATGTTSTPIFVGIARQNAVDTWLAGTGHDRVTGVPGGQAQYARTAGTQRAASSPVTESFWLAQATGSGTAQLQWAAANGAFAVVVANADGSTGVRADIRAAAQVPDLTALGAGLLTTGILLGLVALGLVVLGGIGLGRRHSGPPSSDGPRASDSWPPPPPELMPPVPPVAVP